MAGTFCTCRKDSRTKNVNTGYLEQFLLLFRALVFLIQPRNEYPVVGFIAGAGEGGISAGGQAISTEKVRDRDAKNKEKKKKI
ncbi:hypothetical protein PUN28_013288 [Cardiocondyla obscurior]|uniref:Uncharacterized protein n=1 Tax=Cardiocondyla obscurior TaxID=286306 RepID=A0AAW2FBQ6_9HYME